MHIILPGSPKNSEGSIRLDTAMGTPIANSQISELSTFEQNQFSAFRKWEESAIKRTCPSGRYNCHGMTFASRRTGIYSSEELNKILAEDGYIEIERDSALPGDIIIYFGDDGDFEHSGIVVSKPDKQLGIPKVISKWGKYSEFVHQANNCPYSFKATRYYRIIKS